MLQPFCALYATMVYIPTYIPLSSKTGLIFFMDRFFRYEVFNTFFFRDSLTIWSISRVGNDQFRCSARHKDNQVTDKCY